MANIERPKTPLDETLWRDQAWYRTWGPLTNFTVMDYFRMSTFFDNTSNNGTLFQQMQFRPEIRQELATPELFNMRLKRMTGVEYMLSTGSQETGVWVIRKQLRKGMKVDDNTGREVEDITVLATYYITGENIFQAPSIGAVLQNRMLTAITALRKAQSIATNLSSFTPTKTLPPTTSTATSTNTSMTTSMTTATAPSSQATQATQSQQPPPSTQSSTTAAPSSSSTSSSTYLKDPTLLPRALTLHLKYQNEYMDDHAPLLGDPGSFLHSQGTVSGSQGGSSRSGTPALGGKVGEKKVVPVGRGAVVAGGPVEKKPVVQAPTVVRRKSKGGGLGN